MHGVQGRRKATLDPNPEACLSIAKQTKHLLIIELPK